jgi:hypothetical protein
VGFVLAGLLCCSGGFDAVEVLLIESSIFIDAMLPSLFFEAEIIVKDVLSIGHFALDP